jgi:hypothetical protein
MFVGEQRRTWRTGILLYKVGTLHPESKENAMNEIVDVVKEYWLYWSIPLVFLAVVLWIYRPSARSRYKEDGNMPF